MADDVYEALEHLPDIGMPKTVSCATQRRTAPRYSTQLNASQFNKGERP
jgi:hypothetical protein